MLKDAVTRLQEKTGFDWSDLGLITSTTITGVSVPSLEARLMNLLPIPKNVVRNPLYGLGCLGGVAGLNRTSDLLKVRPNKLALLLAAEACSLTFQGHDATMGNMVACSLFGDGAAAVLLAGEEHPLSCKAPLRILDGMNSFYPDTERVMGWDMVNSGFKVILSGDVPLMVETHLGEDAENFLKKNGLNLSNVSNLISHPGGPKVLRALVKALKKDDSLAFQSWNSLRDHGNLSSVSVLNVLQRSLEESSLNEGHTLALALGPGFNAEMCLMTCE
jgi:alkylresorcinol/alkylpyrone synthase